MLGSELSNHNYIALRYRRDERKKSVTEMVWTASFLSMFALIGFILFLHAIALFHIYSENIQNIEAGGGFFLVLVYQIKNGDIATMYCITAICITLKYAIRIGFKYVHAADEASEYNPKYFYPYMITEEFIRSRKIQEDALELLAEHIERQQESKDFHPK